MASVLICDDAMFIRASIRKMVEAEGFQVVAEAGNGAECIAAYQSFHPDLVLMDITMPDMDGITATKKIKEIDQNAKIIIVSALGLQEKVFEAITAGAKDFVVKPFEQQTLIRCMKKYV